MENNNTDSSFLDNAKKFAVDVYNEPSRVLQNRTERQAIVDRETKSNVLSSRQLEQLKKISNSDDAQRFVEAAQLGGATGGQKEYEEIMNTQRKALLSFGTDVAEMAAGGAVAKGGIKVFKGVAGAIGDKIPALTKASNIFKSEATLAREAKAAEDAKKAADDARKASERAQREADARKQAENYVENKRGAGNNKTSPFKSNAERVKEEPTKIENTTDNDNVPGSKSYFRRAAEWVGDKTLGVGKWVGSQVLKEASTLGKSAIKGGLLGGVASLGAKYGIYDNLSEENQKLVRENAQSLVDKGFEKAPELLDSAGKRISEFIDNPEEKLKSLAGEGEDLVEEYGPKAASAALGAYVTSDTNPFKGVFGGMGSLFPSSNSAEATLSSMPSGGDSGTTGESHFGSDDMSGKSAIEVLNKIYSVLSKIFDEVRNISRDTTSLVRSQSQQDVASDLASSNMRARQNEGSGGGTATAIYGGGGESVDLNAEDSEKSKSIWEKAFSKVSDFVPGKKVLKGALIGGAAVGAGLYSGAAHGHTDEENISAKKLKPGEKGVPVNISDTSDEYLKTVGLIESHGIANVKAKESSATGLYQFTAGTWKDTVKEMGKNYTLEDRKDPKKAEEVMRYFTNKNKRIFAKQTGREPTNKESYMSHFLGAGGAAKFANAGPNATAANVLPSAASANYNIFYDKHTGRKRTVGEVTGIMGGRYDEGLHGLQTGKYQGREIPSTIRNIGGNSKSSEQPQETVIGIDGKQEEPKQNNVSKVMPNNKEEPKELNYTLADDHSSDGGKYKIDLETRKKTKATPEEIKQFYGGGPVLSDEELKQKYKEDPNFKVSDLQKTKVTATPVNSKMDDMEAEVQDIDDQRASLKAEREKIGMAVNVSGEQFNIDEDRLKDISTEMGLLNERRNNITGSKDYLEGIEQQKSGGKQQSQAPTPTQKQTPPQPKTNAGTGKNVPAVRNDDPTIKMMEEGNMWRTNSHEA